MLSCKQMTDKLSAQLDGELSVFERLSVRFHQFLCEDCKQAAANMHALVSSMKDRPPAPVSPSESGPEDRVDEEYVDRIMAALKEKQEEETR